MTRADAIVVILIGTLIGALYAATWAPRVAAEQVQIYVDRNHYGTYDLATPQKIVVEGVIGPTQLQIENGHIRFQHAPCRNKVCLRVGALNDSGDFAACVPNHVSIHLIGGERRYDSINF